MISIIIVNYKTEYYVNACIDSIEQQCSGTPHEIIVVDNSCIDARFKNEIIKKGVKYIDSGGNLGFGRGCNLGAKAACGSILLFVNPDVYFTKNVLALIQNSFDKIGRQSILGVNLVDETGAPACVSGHFPGITSEILELFYIHKFLPRISGSFKLNNSYSSIKDKFIEVDYVSGALFAIDDDVFQKLGGFSNRIFLYFEETELMYRHRKNGGNVVLILEACACHIGSVSTKKNSDFQIMHMELGRMIFYQSRYGLIRRVLVRLIRGVRLFAMALLKMRLIYLRLIPAVLLGEKFIFGDKSHAPQ